jgi:hypothetical protein
VGVSPIIEIEEKKIDNKKMPIIRIQKRNAFYVKKKTKLFLANYSACG